jgi:hypothetical protein
MSDTRHTVIATALSDANFRTFGRLRWRKDFAAQNIIQENLRKSAKSVDKPWHFPPRTRCSVLLLVRRAGSAT